VAVIYYLTRLASWLAGHVPRPIRLAIAGPVTVLIYLGWLAKRHNTIANMAQVLGTSESDPRARQLARDSWRNYGRYVSDFFYLPNATSQEILARMVEDAADPGSFARIDEALAPGKGAIVVSFHFGAYDVAGVILATHTPVDLIVESFEDPRMDRLVMEQRAQFGLGILRIEKTPRQILRALQENRVVAVAVDRPVPEKEGIPVTFFGKTCYVPGGIAQIALKTGAALVPGYCRYDGEYSTNYYIGALPPIFPDSTGDRQRDTSAAMQQLFTALEEVIRKYPEQWYMFRRFWPASEPADATLAPVVMPAADGRDRLVDAHD
jgi:lauroyl/myristoyl acyltransferase